MSAADEQEWAVALKKLGKIGFADTRKNIKLLKRKGGNVDKVIAALAIGEEVSSSSDGSGSDSDSQDSASDDSSDDSLPPPEESPPDFTDSEAGEDLADSDAKPKKAAAAKKSKKKPAAASSSSKKPKKTKERKAADDRSVESFLYRRESAGKFFGRHRGKWKKLFCAFDGRLFTVWTEDRAKQVFSAPIPEGSLVTAFSKDLYATERSREGFPFSVKLPDDRSGGIMWEAETQQLRSRWLKALGRVATVEGLEVDAVATGSGAAAVADPNLAVDTSIIGGVNRVAVVDDRFTAEMYLELKTELKKNKSARRRFCVMGFQQAAPGAGQLQFFDDERRLKQREVLATSGPEVSKVFVVDAGHPDADSKPGAMLLYPNVFEDTYVVLIAGSDEARDDLLRRIGGRFVSVEDRRQRTGDSAGGDEAAVVGSAEDGSPGAAGGPAMATAGSDEDRPTDLGSLAGQPKNLHQVFAAMHKSWEHTATKSLKAQSAKLEGEKESLAAEAQRVFMLQRMLDDWGNLGSLSCLCGSGTPCPLRMAHTFLQHGGRQVLARLVQLCLGQNRHYWQPPKDGLEREEGQAKTKRAKKLAGIGNLASLPGSPEERAAILAGCIRMLASLFHIARSNAVSRCVNLSAVRAELPAGNFEVVRAQSKQAKDQVLFIVNVQIVDADPPKRWTVARPLEEFRAQYEQLEAVLKRSEDPGAAGIQLKPLPPPLGGVSEAQLNARRAGLHTAFAYLTSDEVLQQLTKVSQARTLLLRMLGVRRHDSKEQIGQTLLEAVLAITDELGPTRQVPVAVVDQILGLVLGRQVQLMAERAEALSREGSTDGSLAGPILLPHLFTLLQGAPLAVLVKALEQLTHALIKVPQNCELVYSQPGWQEWFTPLVVETYSASAEGGGSDLAAGASSALSSASSSSSSSASPQGSGSSASSSSGSAVTVVDPRRAQAAELKAQAYRLALHLFVLVHSYYVTMNERDVRAGGATRAVETLIRSTVAAIGQYRPAQAPGRAGLVGSSLRDPQGNVCSLEELQAKLAEWRQLEEQAAQAPAAPGAGLLPRDPYRTAQLLSEDPWDRHEGTAAPSAAEEEEPLVCVRLVLPLGLTTESGPYGWGARIRSIEEKGSVAHYNKAALRRGAPPIRPGDSLLALRTATGAWVNCEGKRFKQLQQLLRAATQGGGQGTGGPDSVCLVVGWRDDAIRLSSGRWQRLIGRPRRDTPASLPMPGHSRTATFGGGLPGGMDLSSPTSRRSRTITRGSFSAEDFFTSGLAAGAGGGGGEHLPPLCSSVWGDERVWAGGSPGQPWSRRNIEVCRAVVSGIILKLHSAAAIFRQKHDMLHWDGALQVLATCQRLLWWELPVSQVVIADPSVEGEDPDDLPPAPWGSSGTTGGDEDAGPRPGLSRRGTLLERAGSIGGPGRKYSTLRSRKDPGSPTGGPLPASGSMSPLLQPLGAPATAPGTPALTARALGVGAGVECEGYLYKRGAKRKSWKRRYFSLKADTLSWFESQKTFEKGKALGSLTITGARVVSFVGNVWLDEGRRGKCFSVSSVVGKRRTLVLEAPDTNGMLPWINAFSAGGAVDAGLVENKKDAEVSAAGPGSPIPGSPAGPGSAPGLPHSPSALTLSPSAAGSSAMSLEDINAFGEFLASGPDRAASQTQLTLPGAAGQSQAAFAEDEGWADEIDPQDLAELDGDDPRGLVLLNAALLERINAFIRALKIFDIDTGDDVMIGQNADDRKRIAEHRALGLHFMEFFREAAKTWAVLEASGKLHEGSAAALQHQSATRGGSSSSSSSNNSSSASSGGWSERPDSVSWCLGRALRLLSLLQSSPQPLATPKEVVAEVRFQKAREEAAALRKQSQLPLLYDSDPENGAAEPPASGNGRLLPGTSSWAETEEARELQFQQDLLDLRRGIAAWKLPGSGGGPAERGFLFVRRLRAGGEEEDSRSSVRSKLGSTSTSTTALSATSSAAAGGDSAAGAGAGGEEGPDEDDEGVAGGAGAGGPEPEYQVTWVAPGKEASGGLRLLLSGALSAEPLRLVRSWGVFRSKDTQWLGRLGNNLEMAAPMALGLAKGAEGRRSGGLEVICCSPADHHTLARALARLCNQTATRRRRRAEIEERRRAQEIKQAEARRKLSSAGKGSSKAGGKGAVQQGGRAESESSEVEFSGEDDPMLQALRPGSKLLAAYRKAAVATGKDPAIVTGAVGSASGSDADQDPVIQGVLRVRARGDLGSRKRWSLRYAVFDGVFISVYASQQEFEEGRAAGAGGAAEAAQLGFAVKDARVVSFTAQVWAGEGCTQRAFAVKVAGAKPSHALVLEAKDDRERYQWVEALSQRGAQDGGLVDSWRGVMTPAEEKKLRRLEKRKKRLAEANGGDSAGGGGASQVKHAGLLPVRRRPGKWKPRYVQLHAGGADGGQLRVWASQERAEAGEPPSAVLKASEHQIVSFRRAVWADERKHTTKSFAVYPRSAKNMGEAPKAFVATLGPDDGYNWLKALIKLGFSDAGVASDKLAENLEPRKKSGSDSAAAAAASGSSNAKSSSSSSSSKAEAASSKAGSADSQQRKESDAKPDSSAGSKGKDKESRSDAASPRSRRTPSQGGGSGLSGAMLQGELGNKLRKRAESMSKTPQKEKDKEKDKPEAAKAGSKSGSSKASASSSSAKKADSDDDDDVPPPPKTPQSASDSSAGDSDSEGSDSGSAAPPAGSNSEDDSGSGSGSDGGSSSDSSDSGADSDDLPPPDRASSVANPVRRKTPAVLGLQLPRQPPPTVPEEGDEDEDGEDEGDSDSASSGDSDEDIVPPPSKAVKASSMTSATAPSPRLSPAPGRKKVLSVLETSSDDDSD